MGLLATLLPHRGRKRCTHEVRRVDKCESLILALFCQLNTSGRPPSRSLEHMRQWASPRRRGRAVVVNTSTSAAVTSHAEHCSMALGHVSSHSGLRSMYPDAQRLCGGHGTSLTEIRCLTEYAGDRIATKSTFDPGERLCPPACAHPYRLLLEALEDSRATGVCESEARWQQRLKRNIS